MIGIYKLVFEDGTFYIGQSTNLEKRFSSHVHTKGLGSPKLENAFKVSTLKDSILLEECTLEDLNAREVFWITELKPTLNTLPGGSSMSGLNHPRAKYSKEQIQEVVRLYTETEISAADISVLTEIGIGTVHDICKGRSQRWATEHLDLEQIRANKEASKSVVVYSPDNTKYIVDYFQFTEFCRNHEGISNAQLTAFRNKTQNITKSGWSTYPKANIEYTLVSDEGIEFTGSKEYIVQIMKDFSIPKYSKSRILEGNISKGWYLKEI